MGDSFGYDDVMQLALFVLAVGVALLRMHAAFTAKIDTLHARCNQLRSDMAAYELRANRDFASVEHLKEVEGRLVISIDRLTGRIDLLLGRIDHNHIEGS